jgi:hypothetical protein
VADGAGTLHSVWFALPFDEAGAFYGRLGNGRVDGQRKLGSAAAEHPDLAAAGDMLAVVWKEFDGERTQLRAMTSSDRGQTWRDQVLASTGDASGHPQLLEAGAGFVVFWNTRAEGLTLTAVPR